MRNVWTYGLALLFVAAFAACRNDPGEVNSLTKKDSFPLLTTRNADMLYTDSGQVKVHMTAPVLEDYSGMVPKTVFPEGIFLEFYDDSGKVTSSLKADYAERRTKEDIMLAKKNVVVVNIKGEQLNTEKLIRDGKRKKIYTDAFVKITTADQVIMGNGLESDDTFTEYEIKDITGTIMLDE